jgi:hypothetical protein
MVHCDGMVCLLHRPILTGGLIVHNIISMHYLSTVAAFAPCRARVRRHAREEAS